MARTVIGCLMTVGLCLGAVLAATPQNPPEQKNPADKRKGVVTGIVTAKGETWIEIRGDGEEKPRRYVPHWRGGAPAQGGGLDKEMLAQIRATPLNSRVRIEWEFEERPRVVKIEILKKPDNPRKD